MDAKVKVKEKLDKLYDLYAHQEVRRLQKQELIDSLIPDEIRQQIADVEAEFEANDFISDTVASLEDEIREDIKRLGETVKGDGLMASYVKGRTSWDTKGLDGYAVAHSEIRAFRKVGDPSVALKKVAK